MTNASVEELQNVGEVGPAIAESIADSSAIPQIGSWSSASRKLA